MILNSNYNKGKVEKTTFPWWIESDLLLMISMIPFQNEWDVDHILGEGDEEVLLFLRWK